MKMQNIIILRWIDKKISMSKLLYTIFLFLFFYGCQSTDSNVHFSCKSPKLEDVIVKDSEGNSLALEYEGERMYTFVYYENIEKNKRVSTVYCGYPSPNSFVRARAYCEDDGSGTFSFVRCEVIVDDNPMVMRLEIFESNNLVSTDWITQGKSRLYFEQYRQINGLVNITKPSYP